MNKWYFCDHGRRKTAQLLILSEFWCTYPQKRRFLNIYFTRPSFCHNKIFWRRKIHSILLQRAPESWSILPSFAQIFIVAQWKAVFIRPQWKKRNLWTILTENLKLFQWFKMFHWFIEDGLAMGTRRSSTEIPCRAWDHDWSKSWFRSWLIEICSGCSRVRV